ncbi:hypothetical protein SAMN05421827_1317 [Pedobacter terrae]|uniref:Uncharacterized protein n=1 Tax=Pedobacter terrae TaxID=405671 RepID=A0A1G8DQZ5_9SPHI|nr:hypothetical protein SAMN05421827_1317 [Pedobacter terrae]
MWFKKAFWKARPAFHFNVSPAVRYSPHASGLPLPSGLDNLRLSINRIRPKQSVVSARAGGERFFGLDY